MKIALIIMSISFVLFTTGCNSNSSKEASSDQAEPASRPVSTRY